GVAPSAAPDADPAPDVLGVSSSRTWRPGRRSSRRTGRTRPGHHPDEDRVDGPGDRGSRGRARDAEGHVDLLLAEEGHGAGDREEQGGQPERPSARARGAGTRGGSAMELTGGRPTRRRPLARVPTRALVHALLDLLLGAASEVVGGVLGLFGGALHPRVPPQLLRLRDHPVVLTSAGPRAEHVTDPRADEQRHLPHADPPVSRLPAPSDLPPPARTKPLRGWSRA